MDFEMNESTFRAASWVNVFQLSSYYLKIDDNWNVAHKSVNCTFFMIPLLFLFNSGHYFLLHFSTAFENNLSLTRKSLFQKTLHFSETVTIKKRVGNSTFLCFKIKDCQTYKCLLLGMQK